MIDNKFYKGKEIFTYVNNIRTDIHINRLEEMGYNIWTFETRNKIINYAFINNIFKQKKISLV
jgi:hypothetical protein